MTMMMMGLQPKTVSDAPVKDSDADGESEDGEDGQQGGQSGSESWC